MEWRKIAAFIRRKIKYKGHTFFRNEDGYYRNGQTTLHRYKYERKYGTIFSCFHLHHIDVDNLNNTLSNLIIVSSKEHMLIYKKLRRYEIFRNQLLLNL